MKSKRILIMSLAYYPQFVGGAEVAIKEITDRIAPSEVVFDMVTLRLNSRLPKFEKIGNVNIYRIGFAKENPSPSDLVRFPLYLSKVFFPVLAVWQFWKLEKKNHYDGVWAMMSYMGMAAVLIRLFIRKIPFVLTLQEGDDLNYVLGRFRIKPFAFLIKKAFRDAVVVQPISEYLAKWAKEIGAKKVVVVPNGVSVKRIKNQESRIKNGEIRERYNIGEKDKVIITTSRLVPKNGVDTLIKSLQFLPPDIKLLIAGVGPDLRKLQKIMLAMNLKDRVVFAGYVTQENIINYLNEADVFCRPSRTEGQGISFLEAMAARLPVVGTAVGGITDFLRDKETGLIAKVDDAEDVARKILILVRDEAVRDEVKFNARKMIEDKYDWDKIVNRLKDEVFNNLEN